MVHINTKLGQIKGFVTDDQLSEYAAKVESTFKTIYDKSGAGSDFLGWVTLPSEINDGFIQDIKNQADILREKSEIFVVVGIGGSYLGARAVIEALSHQFAPFISRKGETQVVYAGHNMSEEYMVELLELLDNKDYSMAVISKSGTTTEPAVAFRILKNHIEKKYGKEEAKTRIVAITDKERGALKTLADNEGYKTYVVPDDVGGRYSVLTPVGLLPIAVAGIDIEQLVKGALEVERYCQDNKNADNEVAKYAIARQALYHQGKTNEIMVSYEPRLHYIAEWWKQLYGESEGKDGKGIFPASDTFTTDLHSMGQYIQEGRRNLFEQHGNYEIMDYYWAIDEGKIDKDYHVWWGYEDLKIFDYAEEELLKISKKDEPFNFTLLTADTHFTDGYMDDSCEIKFDNKYANAFYCADSKLGKFVSWIKKQDFYDDTVIVIVGDHLVCQEGLYKNDETNRYVYNVIINSDVKTDNNKNRQVSHFDMMPTTLAAMGATIEGERLGLGVNLFSDKKTLIERFGIDYVNEELLKKSVYYNDKIIGDSYYDMMNDKELLD